MHVIDFHGNSPKFIALLLEALRLERFIASTGVPSLNRNFIHPILVPVPPVDEQNEIAYIIGWIVNQVSKEEACKQRLEQLKKALLQVLLTGKLRIQIIKE